MPTEPGKKRTKRKSGPNDDARSQWQQRVVLQTGETLRFIGRTCKGNLDQNEVEEYEIVDLEGAVKGTVTLRTSTSLRPPHRTSYSLEQRDVAGTLTTQAMW